MSTVHAQGLVPSSRPPPVKVRYRSGIKTNCPLGRDVVRLGRDVVRLGRDVVRLGRDVVRLGRDVVSL